MLSDIIPACTIRSLLVPLSYLLHCILRETPARRASAGSRVGTPRILKNKPLIEAILELRWALEKGPAPELGRDPHYKFLLGKLFEAVRNKFPSHEELPPASMPEELTGHTVHHRFRVGANAWPLLQVGPGVFTANDTVDYTWDRFEELINWAVPTLISSHPQPDALQFQTLMLRFLNAVPVDAKSTDLLAFLSTKMRFNLSLPHSIFEDGNVQPTPHRFATELVFPCSAPPGALLVKLNTGQREGSPVLVFELWFVTNGRDMPRMPDGFREWASKAHAVIESSFFHLIEGDLEKEFAGDG